MSEPDLTGRVARCSYFGGNAPRKNTGHSGCDACGTSANARCACTAPSSPKLAFFRFHGDDTPDVAAMAHNKRFESGKFDEFYCGCHGWD